MGRICKDLRRGNQNIFKLKKKLLNSRKKLDYVFKKILVPEKNYQILIDDHIFKII